MQDVMAKDEVFSACTHPEAQSLAISPRTPISISLSSSLNSSLADVDNKSTGGKELIAKNLQMYVR